MLSTKMIVPVVALAAAFTFALSDQAQAEHGHHGGGHGNHGGGHGNHVGHHGGGNLGGIIGSHIGGHGGGRVTRQWNGYRQSYRPATSIGWGQPQYHDTTHLDYHAPQLKRHGNHFHVQPGHYDVHRSGHWH